MAVEADRYNHAAKAHDPIKHAHNALFARHTRYLDPTCEGSVVSIDGSEAQTSHAAGHVGYPPSRIHAVNENKKNTTAIRKRRIAVTHTCALRTFLSAAHRRRQRFRGIYADTCGTVQRYKRDIPRALRVCDPRGAVFQATFTLRNPYGGGDQDKVAIAFFEQYAKLHGFSYRCILNRRYSKNMFTFAYELRPPAVTRAMLKRTQQMALRSGTTLGIL